MKLLDTSGAELMQVGRIERDGADLLIKGKIYGSMPMTARLTPAEARRALKLIDLRLCLFVLKMLLRG